MLTLNKNRGNELKKSISIIFLVSFVVMLSTSFCFSIEQSINPNEIIIQDEDDVLTKDVKKNDVFVIKSPFNVRGICSNCGKNGLNIAKVMENHDITQLNRPYTDYPSGDMLYHYKVYSGIRCNYCGFKASGLTFLYDRVESYCYDHQTTRWVIPGINHLDGYDRHQCPDSCCQDVYSRFDIVNLK